MLDDRSLEAAVALLLLDAPSMGPKRVIDLVTLTGSAHLAFEKLRSSASASVREFLDRTSLDTYLSCLQRTRDLGADFKLWSDADYPANLRRWDGRPPVLFYKGDLSGLSTRALALVGRVDPTNEGSAAAERFARKCVEHAIAVVSGAAKGIDGASHRAALSEPPGDTFAVLGHGLEHAYPKENHDLYAAIPGHGALISQFRPAVGPQRWTFPIRNELMCTLALGTVIIEGRPGCGSLIQADFSFKHRRPVFLLRRNVINDDTGWTTQLVKRGAHVIERFDQVLEVVEREAGQAWEPSVNVQSLFKTTDGSAPANHAAVTSAAIFDLDGVVVDTRDATAACLSAIVARHTGSVLDPRTIDITGSPISVLARLGVPKASVVYTREYDAAFAEAIQNVHVFTEVVDTLKRLRDQDVRLGAVTAQPKRRAVAILPQHVRDLFDVFLTYNETGGKKEVGIRRALSQLGVAKEKAVFVGDQRSDLMAAQAAGVRGVGVLWGFSAQDELESCAHTLLVKAPGDLAKALITLLPLPISAEAIHHVHA